MAKRNGDYEVGYGKPPKHSQFKGGQSGNPGGRSKGNRGLKTDLQAELAARHTIQMNGQPMRGTRQKLMVATLAARAASGDLKAQALLIPLILQVFGVEDRGIGRERLSVQDQALLDQLLAPDPEGSSAVDPGTSDARDRGDPEGDTGSPQPPIGDDIPDPDLENDNG